MQLFFGIIIGLCISILVFVVLCFFKKSIIKKVEKTQTFIEQKSPDMSGAIFPPIDEAEEARAEHIENNKKQGKDTPLSELM